MTTITNPRMYPDPWTRSTTPFGIIYELSNDAEVRVRISVILSGSNLINETYSSASLGGKVGTNVVFFSNADINPVADAYRLSIYLDGSGTAAWEVAIAIL